MGDGVIVNSDAVPHSGAVGVNSKPPIAIAAPGASVVRVLPSGEYSVVPLIVQAGTNEPDVSPVFFHDIAKTIVMSATNAFVSVGKVVSIAVMFAGVATGQSEPFKVTV